jgi:hypothetical protein
MSGFNISTNSQITLVEPIGKLLDKKYLNSAEKSKKELETIKKLAQDEPAVLLFIFQFDFCKNYNTKLEGDSFKLGSCGVPLYKITYRYGPSDNQTVGSLTNNSSKEFYDDLLRLKLAYGSYEFWIEPIFNKDLEDFVGTIEFKNNLTKPNENYFKINFNPTNKYEEVTVNFFFGNNTSELISNSLVNSQGFIENSLVNITDYHVEKLLDGEAITKAGQKEFIPKHIVLHQTAARALCIGRWLEKKVYEKEIKDGKEVDKLVVNPSGVKERVLKSIDTKSAYALAHFTIHSDGSIYQSSSIFRTTYHAIDEKGKNIGNSNSIGIEFSGKGGDLKGDKWYDKITEKQMRAADYLIDLLLCNLNITSIIKHPDTSVKHPCEAKSVLCFVNYRDYLNKSISPNIALTQ